MSDSNNNPKQITEKINTPAKPLVSPEGATPAADTLVSKPDPTNIKSIICKPKIPITIEETIAVDLAVIRSMSTDDNAHSASGYWMLMCDPNAEDFQVSDLALRDGDTPLRIKFRATCCVSSTGK